MTVYYSIKWTSWFISPWLMCCIFREVFEGIWIATKVSKGLEGSHTTSFAKVAAFTSSRGFSVFETLSSLNLYLSDGTFLVCTAPQWGAMLHLPQLRHTLLGASNPDSIMLCTVLVLSLYICSMNEYWIMKKILSRKRVLDKRHSHLKTVSTHRKDYSANHGY